MAIIGPNDLPVVMRIPSDPIKKYVLTKLGYPVVDVEITEDQFETILRTSGDWIAGYFPLEQRLAVFNTAPLQSTYPLPKNAYWIQECHWDPSVNRFDIFGAESFLFNIGTITGIQEMLVDFHLLQAYRKTSQKILGTEGHWEVINEVDGDTTQQLIRLYPTPKGVFPVVVLFQPVVTHFRSPQARKICMDMILAEAKCVVGAARRKIANMPSPTGGTLQTDGDVLVQEGIKELDEITLKAIQYGEPMPISMWGLLFATCVGLLQMMGSV